MQRRGRDDVLALDGSSSSCESRVVLIFTSKFTLHRSPLQQVVNIILLSSCHLHSATIFTNSTDSHRCRHNARQSLVRMTASFVACLHCQHVDPISRQWLGYHPLSLGPTVSLARVGNNGAASIGAFGRKENPIGYCKKLNTLNLVSDASRTPYCLGIWTA